MFCYPLGGCLDTYAKLQGHS